MLFHMPRATLDSFAQEMNVPRVDALRCAAGTVDPVVANIGRAMLPALLQPEPRARSSSTTSRWR
jgi:AraC family transcriptional regulator